MPLEIEEQPLPLAADLRRRLDSRLMACVALALLASLGLGLGGRQRQRQRQGQRQRQRQRLDHLTGIPATRHRFVRWPWLKLGFQLGADVIATSTVPAATPRFGWRWWPSSARC